MLLFLRCDAKIRNGQGEGGLIFCPGNNYQYVCIPPCLCRLYVLIVMSGKERRDKQRKKKKWEMGWMYAPRGRKGGEGGGSLRDECEGSLYYGARTHAREGKVTVYGCSIWLMLTH